PESSPKPLASSPRSRKSLRRRDGCAKSPLAQRFSSILSRHISFHQGLSGRRKFLCHSRSPHPFAAPEESMSSIANRALSFTCLCLLAATTASAQSYRTISVGVGLGHLIHGVGNQPLRLSNDAMAIVSDGSSEGFGAPDDAIVIIRGFESGLLSTSFVGLSTALGTYGDLPHNLVRLDDRT